MMNYLEYKLFKWLIEEALDNWFYCKTQLNDEIIREVGLEK